MRTVDEPITDDAVALLDRAREALAALGAVDLDGLGDGDLTELVMGAQALRGALDAAEARVLAEWDRRRTWRASGAKTAAAWLAWQQRLPIAEARRRLRHARLTRQYPKVHEAWATGALDRTHLVTLFGCRTARTQAAFDDEHEDLLDSAKARGFVDFKRHCDTWGFFRDPDGAEDRARDDHDARELHLNQSFGGLWFGRVATPSMVDSQAAELSVVRAAALASAGVRSRSESWGRCSL